MTTRTKTRRRPQLETLEGRALLATAGTLDPTFGTGGRVVTAISAGLDDELTTVIQPDGKIVAVGDSPSPTWTWDVARYNPDGTPDTSFGSGGKATTPLRGYAWSASLYPDTAHPDAPKVLEAGLLNGTAANGYKDDFQMVRWNSNGTLDTSFGGTGMVTAGSGSGSDELAGAVVLPDGKILAGGDTTSTPSGVKEMVLLRYNADGTLDTTFGNGGKVLAYGRPSDPTIPCYMNSLTLQPDGKVVAFGQSGDAFTPSGRWNTVVRFNPDGTPDTSFGTDGTGHVFLGQGQNAYPGKVAVQPDGEIVLAGGWAIGSAQQFALARLNPDGTPDQGFGSGGMVGVPQAQTARDVAFQVVGGAVTGIVAVGTASGSAVVARFDASGHLDGTFGSGGLVTDASYSAMNLAIQPDGNILVGGNTPTTPSNRDFIVNRYLGSAQAVPQFVVTAQPPSSVTAGAPFGLTVEATDASGNLMPSYNGTVTVALAANPGGAALGGTLTATASNGFASFSGLWLNKAAGGYTLSASGVGLAPATTTAIAVTPAAPTQLVIVDQPETVGVNSPFVIQAAIEDQYGNVVTTATNAVTVSLAGGPSGATLGGTTTLTPVGGYVTFSNLTVNKRGKGYRIKLTSTGLTGTTTNSFTAS
jgi:uncharacterized delta-60 repeat protein